MRTESSSRFRFAVTAGALVAAVVAGVIWVSTLLEYTGGPSARYAMAFAIVASNAVVLLIAGLAVSKIQRRRREALETRRKQAILDLLTSGAPVSEVAAFADRWPRQMVDLADQTLAFLEGSARQRISQVARSVSCQQLLLTAVKSGTPKEAARALRVLGELDAEEGWAAISRALDDESETVRIAAKRVVLMKGNRGMKRVILRRLPEMVLWERVLMFHSLELDAEVVEQYLEEALASPESAQRIAALEMIHSRRRVFLRKVSAEIATSPESEVRIKFFKALPFLAIDAETALVLKRGLTDGDWRVRAMSAQACAYFRPAGLVDDLLAMCGVHSHAAEARHAAGALAALGGEAYLYLERMAASGVGVTSGIAADVIEQHILVLAGGRG